MELTTLNQIKIMSNYIYDVVYNLDGYQENESVRFTDKALAKAFCAEISAKIDPESEGFVHLHTYYKYASQVVAEIENVARRPKVRAMLDALDDYRKGRPNNINFSKLWAECSQERAYAKALAKLIPGYSVLWA